MSVATIRPKCNGIQHQQLAAAERLSLEVAFLYNILSMFSQRTTALFATGMILCALSATAGRPQSKTAPPSPATPQQVQERTPPPAIASEPFEAPKFKPDAKKAKEAYREGLRSEQRQDWPSAYEHYSDASNFAPKNEDYLLRRVVAKSQIVQAKADEAERDAVSGRLVEALRVLRSAREMDPSNTVIRDRLTELTALLPRDNRQIKSAPDIASPVHLEYSPGKQTFDFRGDTQSAYEEAARRFGVEVAFDVDLSLRPIRVHLDDANFLQVVDVLGQATGTFWRPLTSHLFFVSEDTPQKRRDYEMSVVRTVLLPASENPEQMTETLRLIRDLTGITRTELNTSSHTVTMRASPRAIAIAADLIDNLEKPSAELILDIEILEVDRNYARQLGILPPQTAQVFTLSQQEVQEAQSSFQGLVDVLTQVFGQPSSLAGLTSSQIGSLLSAGNLGLGALIPPLIAFGGGDSTFLATLPGATANFSEMLSLVRQGRRILLRAEDGQPATFFVGNRIPVSLAQFSPSVAGQGSNVPGLNPENLPITTLTTGTGPQFVTGGDLRNKGLQDLIAANFTDNTLSVFLGNGDGTFETPTTVATGAGPVWIAASSFRNDHVLDLAVANRTANTVSILIGNGDGTFKPKVDLPTGNRPVAVVAAQLNGDAFPDLVVANQTDNTLSIFLGNGDGTFKAPTTLQTGNEPSSIAAFDFNKDGKIDLAVTNEKDNTVSIFLGNGDGTFESPLVFTTGQAPVFVAEGDFNGDTIPDIAVANNTDNTVSILLGNGDGTFGAKTDFLAGNGPTSIAVNDFNVDGIPDLAVSDQADNAVSLLLGLGSGTFGANFELPLGNQPISVFSTDFNADGRPDLAIANFGSNTLSVILNSSQFTSANGLTGTQFPGVEYLDVGVKVKATPRVHLNGDVTLALHLEVSSETAQSLNGIPVIANESVDQTVRVRDEHTAALAGIHQTQLSYALNGTPGVAPIPGAGLIAGTRNNQNQDTDLMFLVTPRIVELTPKKDHVIYAGRGSLNGPGAFGPTRGERQALPGFENRQPIFRPEPQNPPR